MTKFYFVNMQYTHTHIYRYISSIKCVFDFNIQNETIMFFDVLRHSRKLQKTSGVGL